MKEYHKSLQAYEQGLFGELTWQRYWRLPLLPVQECNQSRLMAVVCRIEAGP